MTTSIELITKYILSSLEDLNLIFIIQPSTHVLLSLPSACTIPRHQHNMLSIQVCFQPLAFSPLNPYFRHGKSIYSILNLTTF